MKIEITLFSCVMCDVMRRLECSTLHLLKNWIGPALTLCGSESIIVREHLSVHIQNLFEFSIENKQTETFLHTRKSITMQQQIFWIQVLRNLLDYEQIMTKDLALSLLCDMT